MKTSRKMVAVSMIFWLALSSVSRAQTVTWDGGGANSLLTTAENWTTDTLPKDGVSGTLNANAQAGTTVLDGYDITQIDGTVTPNVTTVFPVGTGSYTVDGTGGGSPQISGFRYFTTAAGGTLTLVNGVVNVSANANADSTVNGSLVVHGGTLTVARRLVVDDTGSVRGTIEINGGTVSSVNTTTANSLGGSNLQSGDYFLNGGDIDFRFLQIGSSTINLFFGGSTAGDLTVENFGGFRHLPANIDIDFAPGSQMSLTLTNPVAYDDPTGDDRFGWANDNNGPAWAEALWSDGRLTFNEQNYTTLGNWAAVTSAGGLGDYTHFVFDGNTLSLERNPPPDETLICIK